MNANELVNILKSPTSKVICFGTAIIAGALLVIPMLNRDDDPTSVRQETELRQEEKAPLDISSNIPRFKLDKRSDAEADAVTIPGDGKPPVINGNAPAKSGDPVGKGFSGKDGNSTGKPRPRSARRQRKSLKDNREKDSSVTAIFPHAPYSTEKTTGTPAQANGTRKERKSLS